MGRVRKLIKRKRVVGARRPKQKRRTSVQEGGSKGRVNARG
jgi:hypothetical protein